MFKSAFYCLAIIGCICVFASCDGRDKAYKTPADSLKEKKLLDSFSENVQYFPKEYAEVETDTLLSNGFRVIIKTFSDMDNGIITDTSTRNDSIRKKTIYREFLSTITVFKEDEVVLHKTINKSTFTDKYKDHADILKEMTLSNTVVNQFIIEDDKVAQIEVDYCRRPNVYKEYPEEYCLHYGLIIYPDGSLRIVHFEY